MKLVARTRRCRHGAARSAGATRRPIRTSRCGWSSRSRRAARPTSSAARWRAKLQEMLGPAGGGGEPRRRRRLGRLGSSCCAPTPTATRCSPTRRRTSRTRRSTRRCATTRCKDFANIAPLAGGPNVLIVEPGDRLEDAAATSSPRRRRSPAGSISPRPASAAARISTSRSSRSMTGIDVAHVPYKGTPEAIADTIAGRVCCYWAPINAALPHVNGGRAVALAVSSAKRSRLLPNVPTRGGAGRARASTTRSGSALWGPAEMPADIVDKINKDVNRALASPDLAERLTKLGTAPMHHDVRRSSPSSCARKSKTPPRFSKPQESSPNEKHLLRIARGLGACFTPRRSIPTSRSR